MKIDKSFSDEQMNILYSTIMECGKDLAASEKRKLDDAGYYMYDFLRETPRSSLVAEIVNKLNEEGYEIKKK